MQAMLAAAAHAVRPAQAVSEFEVLVCDLPSKQQLVVGSSRGEQGVV